MSLFVVAKMDASPVQSSSKCGSDFSIERILGDRKESREREEAPEWLCCTRYRPPRLPRSVGGCRARRAGRHARVPFTAAQAAALEAAYARAPYLAPPALRALAAALQLRDDRIKIWFQNRRARERREKSTTIVPPQAVALPPTTTSSTFPTTWIRQANFIPHNGVFLNPRNYIKTQNSVSCAVSNGAQNPVNFSFQRYKLSPRSDDHDVTQLHDSQEGNSSRPGTPLDIETVED